MFGLSNLAEGTIPVRNGLHVRAVAAHAPAGVGRTFWRSPPTSRLCAAFLRGAYVNAAMIMRGVMMAI